ncbi:MAG: disulfide oxidoreductase [Gemmatimonadota bacterium]|nr:disulfide oxidoreductase [Gemmatimonadota bacterium]
MPTARRALVGTFGRQPFALAAFAWIVATIATLGSLYLSDGLGLEPCKLCWYQRIAMYPLVLVLGIALLRRDADVWKTAVPLALVGAGVSAYHVAVQFIPGVELASCSVTAPCSLRYFVSYGFVTIPVMAGAAFLLVAATLAAHACVVRAKAAP